MIDRFRLQRVQYIPKSLEPGILYVSEEFDVAAHLCACGCGTKVTTPLGPTEWKFSEKDGVPSLWPSIGNWQLPCRSHYSIIESQTRWGEQWSEAQVLAGRKAEEARREAYYVEKDRLNRRPFARFWRWVRGLFRL